MCRLISHQLHCSAYLLICWVQLDHRYRIKPFGRPIRVLPNSGELTRLFANYFWAYSRKSRRLHVNIRKAPYSQVLLSGWVGLTDYLHPFSWVLIQTIRNPLSSAPVAFQQVFRAQQPNGCRPSLPYVAEILLNRVEETRFVRRCRRRCLRRNKHGVVI